MIRKFKKEDIEQVMQIWLQSNLEAHPFIEPEYWENHYEETARMIPGAEVYVYTQEERITGFIGLSGEYIAGIFVEGGARSRGCGRQLLEYVKQRHGRLTLHVYRKNARAAGFYRREGFMEENVQCDEHTGETELRMVWTRPSHMV